MSRWMQFVQLLLSKIQWRPTRALVAKAGVVLGMALVGGAAFFLGRTIGLGAAAAQTTPVKFQLPNSQNVQNADLYPADYSPRVVAYVKGNVPIYRVDLAEYLIARFGAQRLEFLVNRKIVELACQGKGIFVTDQEVEAQFQSDIKAFGVHMTEDLFQKQVLNRYNKTVFEWKEDVIRPKLALTKLVRLEGVNVTEEDLVKGFEMRYGPMVKCRWIIYQDKNAALRGWEKIRSSKNVEEAFSDEASHQYIQAMATARGIVPPIHKHFGDPKVEKEAFSLQKGEISQVLGMSDNSAIILMCDEKLPPTPGKDYQTEKLVLQKTIYEEKLAKQIQAKVIELRKDANPKYHFARQPSFEEVRRESAEEIGEANPSRDAVPNFRGVEYKK